MMTTKLEAVGHDPTVPSTKGGNGKLSRSGKNTTSLNDAIVRDLAQIGTVLEDAYSV